MVEIDVTRLDGRRVALQGLIDYAGLFPPTSLSMEEAVAEYRSARAGPHSWMVDRFVCAASRLEELAGVLTPTMTAGEPPWPVAAVADGGGDDWLAAASADAARVAAFTAELAGGAGVEVVEIRLPRAGPEEVGPLAVAVLEAFDRVVFFEVPWATTDPAGLIAALASVRREWRRALGVKVRSGGISEEAFPPPEAVAVFIAACHDHHLPLKATAGLHHPVRHHDPATGFTHHGFFNLLGASALARKGASLDLLTEVLADDDPGSFRLDRSGLHWRGRRLGGGLVAEARRELLVGYGSCSIDEPVEDLTALGVLPVEG